jgi:hypothetical protein
MLLRTQRPSVVVHPDGLIDKNTALPQSLSTLTSLSDVPQAWLGSGTWGIPSLLLVSLTVSLVIVTTLVRCLCPQPQCHPSPPLSKVPLPGGMARILNGAQRWVCLLEPVQLLKAGGSFLEVRGSEKKGRGRNNPRPHPEGLNHKKLGIEKREWGEPGM